MLEIQGNLWNYHDEGFWVAITTNGCVKANGSAVMGRGVALECALLFPDIPKRLGAHLHQQGNCIAVFPDHRIITFPVKHMWSEPADLKLIEESAVQLAAMNFPHAVFTVRPGCGNGRLKWEDVKPVIENILDDRFIIIERNVL